MAEKENEKLGLFSCIGIIVGGCTGSAIFSLSGQTIKMAGPAAVVSWIAAGLIFALYGMQVCELAVRYPKSGGIFVFPQKAFEGKKGNFWGFISAWGYIISSTIAIAFSAITIGNFMGNAFGVLSGQTWLIAMGVAGTVFCIVLNLLKITDAGKFNNVLVGLLLAGMITFIGFAFFGKRADGSPSFEVSNLRNFYTTGMGFKGMLRAIPIASCAYGACLAVSFMVSEVKNPNRTIPSSLLIGLSIVILLYALMIIATVGTCAYLWFVTPGLEFLEFAPQFGSILFDGLTAYPWIAKVVSLAALIALVTTMLVIMALDARTIQAVAASGYFPEVFAKNNKNNVPAAATLLCGISATLLCFRPNWTSTIVCLGALFNVASMVITCASLIAARKKTTLSEGCYHCPGGTVAPIATIAVLGTCYLIGSISGDVALFTIIIYAAGLVIYFVSNRKKTDETLF